MFLMLRRLCFLHNDVKKLLKMRNIQNKGHNIFDRKLAKMGNMGFYTGPRKLTVCVKKLKEIQARSHFSSVTS